MNTINNLSIIQILAGLSVFLFVLEQIKLSLNNLFATKFQIYISKFVNTKFKSFLFGCLTSAAIQSSSGTTAIAISLLSSKYINDKQCLGIIIGANLGTCLTTFIVALNSDNIFLYILTIGIFLYFCFKKTKKLSILIIYIGFMLFGLNLLNMGFNDIINNPFIYQIIENIQNSTSFSILFGIFSTAIIQSSSGIISIVEEMYVTNLINLKCSIGIMLGANIGTTLTGYIATINTDDNTKKIINMNLIFNVLGVILFVAFFAPFINHISNMEDKFFFNNTKFSIAYAHFIFNLLSVILGYLFFDIFIYFINKKKKYNSTLNNIS